MAVGLHVKLAVKAVLALDSKLLRFLLLVGLYFRAARGPAHRRLQMVEALIEPVDFHFGQRIGGAFGLDVLDALVVRFLELLEGAVKLMQFRVTMSCIIRHCRFPFVVGCLMMSFVYIFYFPAASRGF